VLLDEGAEELPDLGVGRGQVDVAAPDPFRGGPADLLVAEEAQESCRLRVVHDHVVPTVFERERVVEHAFEVRTLHRGRPLDVGALQRVVHVLGDREELVAAVHHLPLGVDVETAQERNVRRQQLGDATAVRGGVDVEDARTTKRFGELAYALDGGATDHVRVVGKVLLEEGDALQHGVPRP